MQDKEFPRIRSKIGCCSIYGLFEPREGLILWFDDDCLDHNREEARKLKPKGMSPEDAEYWLLREMDVFARWSWERNGVAITQEEALGLYLKEKDL